MLLFLNQILFFTLILFSGNQHPLHVSVTNIDYKHEERKMQFAFKLFSDDFDLILTQKYGIAFNLQYGQELPDADLYITKYIKEHFKVTIDNDERTSELSLVKKDKNEEAVWVYYQINCKKEPLRMKIKNTLMTDLFADQKNLVFFVCNKKEYAEMLNNTKTQHAFIIE